MNGNFLIAAGLLLGITGCVSTAKNSAKASMSLEEAICTVQNAIINTRRPEATRAGLAPAEAVVTLTLGFKEVKAGEVGAKLKLGIVEWGPNGSWSREHSSGNTLQIKFGPGNTHYTVSGQAPLTVMQFPKDGGGDTEVKLPDCSTFAAF